MLIPKLRKKLGKKKLIIILVLAALLLGTGCVFGARTLLGFVPVTEKAEKSVPTEAKKKEIAKEPEKIVETRKIAIKKRAAGSATLATIGIINDDGQGLNMLKSQTDVASKIFLDELTNKIYFEKDKNIWSADLGSGQEAQITKQGGKASTTQTTPGTNNAQNNTSKSDANKQTQSPQSTNTDNNAATGNQIATPQATASEDQKCAQAEIGALNKKISYLVTPVTAPTTGTTQTVNNSLGVWISGMTGESPEWQADADTNFGFSPDGKSIIFKRNKEIWITSISDKTEKRFLKGEDITQIEWSPAGDKMCYTKNNNIVLADSAGNELSMLGAVSDQILSDGHFSTDGSGICYSKTNEKGEQALYYMDLNNKTEYKLSVGGKMVSFNKKGDRIIFFKEKVVEQKPSGSGDVYSISLVGGDEKALTNTGDIIY